jgi:HEAT repeat protein
VALQLGLSVPSGNAEWFDCTAPDCSTGTPVVGDLTGAAFTGAAADVGVTNTGGAPEDATLDVVSDGGLGLTLVLRHAIFADSAEVWRDLLRIAKNDNAAREPRKNAVFWLSQEASDAATAGLTELVEDDREDREVREQAVFALSQLPHDQGVPALIKAAKTSKDPEVRKKAIFWLGQSDDPRALTLFEEILATKP